jgi:aryl-alcohol dehydrogenase-like predicted oxidoreductase
MIRVTLAGLETSAQGLGCMGMSEYYGETDWDSSIETIHRAIDLGVTFLDTADLYGVGHNEVLVGRAIHDRRDQVQLATKFGIDPNVEKPSQRIRGARGYVKRACERSLLRLGTGYIDLYYAHRPPQDVEIEETVAAMAELVTEGKVRYLGLSEVGSDLLRRAHTVHPITAVQSEYSVWSRAVEDVTPVMAELGIGLVPYSPLGRGFLTGTIDLATLGAKDVRSVHPRFAGEAGQANLAIAATVRAVAERIGAEPAQVALAWVYAQADRLGVPLVPIPGTKRTRWIEQNVAALAIELDAEALALLDPLEAKVRDQRSPAVPVPDR